MLNFLNSISGALNLLFAAVVCVSTVVYAVLTWTLVKETRQMRRVQTEPNVQVSLESSEFAINLVRLHIKNFGLGAAKSVTLKIHPVSGGEVAAKLASEFSASNFFKTGLAHLGPGHERYSMYTQMFDQGDAKLDCVLAADVRYLSATGESYEDKFLIDMSEKKGDYRLGTPPAQDMARALKEIEQHLSNAGSGFKRLKVDVYTASDRIAERQALDERFGRSAPPSEKKGDHSSGEA